VSAARRETDNRTGPEVIVYDDRQARWVVSERDATNVPGARGPRCLVFMSEHTVRRIWTYPPTWRHLSPDALLALSEQP
jgi:hypothetical protein